MVRFETTSCFRFETGFLLYFPGDCRAGRPLDQLRVQQQRADIHMIELVEHCVERALADVGAVLTNGGQGRQGIAAQRDIVKAKNTDIVGNTKSQLVAVDDRAVSQQIVTADNGGSAGIQYPGQVRGQTLVDKNRVAGEGFVHIQPAILHSPEKGGMTLPVNIGLQGTA